MSISVNKNNILLDGKIIFSRPKINLNIPNAKIEKKKKHVPLNEYKDKYNRLPPTLWCLNEKNGCSCGKQFRNPIKYQNHLLICEFDDNNLINENDKNEEKSPEDIFYELDDDTINLIESYDRMTGNNLLTQFLLGQVNY